MRFRADLIVAGVIVLLCAYAVVRQLGYDPFETPEPPIPRLETGEVLDPDIVLDWIGDPPVPDRIGALYGEKATVVYTWSVPCPCVAHLEARMRAVYARFGPQAGVAWMAVDGEPYDTPEIIRQQMGAIRSFYKLVLDPRQVVVQRLGLNQAVQVAVLDAEGRIRYRGAPDDDYENGDARFLVEALEAVLAGESPQVEERECDYGCLFNDPASCLEFAEETPTDS